MEPVAFFSRLTACEWLIPSAEVPQILTMRSPIWKSESSVSSVKMHEKKKERKNNFSSESWGKTDAEQRYSEVSSSVCRGARVISLISVLPHQVWRNSA